MEHLILYPANFSLFLGVGECVRALDVLKKDGFLTDFESDKIVKTLLTAGVNLKLATDIADEIKGICYDGIPTSVIREKVHARLCEIDEELAEKYLYRTNLRVRTSGYDIAKFDSEKIADSLIKETRVDDDFAREIAKSVEKELAKLKLDYVTAPLIREIVNVKLLEEGMESVRSKYTRLGLPVFDVRQLFAGRGGCEFSPEGIRESMSDQIIREYTLLNALPASLSDAHITGELDIHYLSSFPMEPTTFSHPIHHFLENGLDWNGGKCGVKEAPPVNANEFINQLVKIMVAGQYESSRRQVISGIEYLIAPYIQGLADESINYIAQRLVFEVVHSCVGGTKTINAIFSSSMSPPKHLLESKVVGPGGKILNGSYLDYQEVGWKFIDALISHIKNDDTRFPKIWISPTDMSPEKIGNAISAGSIIGESYDFMEPLRGVCQEVCVNLGRIDAEDEPQKLERIMKDAYEILLIKKRFMEENSTRGFWSYLNQNLGDDKIFDPLKQSYVISYNGLDRVADLQNEVGIEYAEGILKDMQEMVGKFSTDAQLKFNLHPCASKTCAERFRKHDGVEKPICLGHLPGEKFSVDDVDLIKRLNKFVDQQMPLEIDGSDMSPGMKLKTAERLIEEKLCFRFI